jgi:hypothetical protein
VRWLLVVGLLVVAAPAFASDCARRIALESSDPAVVAAVSAGLSDSRAHLVEGDEAACVALRVRVERVGPAWVVSTARDGQPAEDRRVEGLEAATALIEVMSHDLDAEPWSRADEAGRSVTASVELTFRPSHPRTWGALVEVRQPLDLGLGPLALMLRLRAAGGSALEVLAPRVGELWQRDRELGASLGLATRWVLIGALTVDVGVAGGVRSTSVTVELPPCDTPQDGCPLASYWPAEDGSWTWGATAELTLGVSLAMTRWLEARVGASAELASSAMRPHTPDDVLPLATRVATGLRVALP